MLLCLLVCASVHQEPHDSRSLQRSPRLPSHDIAFDEYAAMSLDSKDPHGRCAPAPGIIRKSSSFLRCGDGELGYVHVGKTGGPTLVTHGRGLEPMRLATPLLPHCLFIWPPVLCP